MTVKPIFQSLTALLCLVACSSDSYHTGDGSLSLLRADFVEAATDHDAYVSVATTDDGLQLQLSPRIKTSWTTTPDSLYRALFYYNMASDDAEPTSVGPVSLLPVLNPPIYRSSYYGLNPKTDPVVFQSAWLSGSGKYVNFDLDVKTGTTDGAVGSQVIGWIYDGTEDDDAGRHTAKFRLYHDQHGVPEYYSAKLYVSLCIPSMPCTLTQGDQVQVRINTYEGEVVKTFTLK